MDQNDFNGFNDLNVLNALETEKPPRSFGEVNRKETEKRSVIS